MNKIELAELEQVKTLTEGKAIPAFSPGDTLKVNVKVVEGSRERVQAFEGVCIARSNNGLHSSFTVRKLSYGEGVERVFPLFSPNVQSIEVVRRGDVRRSKLYYLRGLQGKRARIAERTDGFAAKLSAEERQLAADQKFAANASQLEALESEGEATENEIETEQPSESAESPEEKDTKGNEGASVEPESDGKKGN